ncbi:MAG: hypothetical protein Fur0022_03660 [Anaerolineales bacterium]
MITHSSPSISDSLSLEDTIARLKASPLVDGVAEFGSRTGRHSAVSDHDLLILVQAIPARVFQMVTTIGGRLADIVLVETETADSLLTAPAPQPRSFEALFAQKMKTARILYDASGRLEKVQQLVTGERTSSNISDADLYATWFWQSHALLHLERMAQSPDPLYLSAVDMMLTANLPGTWRSYFDIHNLPWEGEKAALRHWAAHDPGYLHLVRQCLEAVDRHERLAAYRSLVEQTLAPVGQLLVQGETAVMLAGPNEREEVERVLGYWEGLVGG